MKHFYSFLFVFVFLTTGVLSAQTYYTISTIAGIGASGYSGDSNLAINAKMFPYFVTTNKRGDIYLTDFNASVIRKIDKNTGIIYTIAGTGTTGYNGDGIPATTAKLYSPWGINFGISGEDTAALFVCDQLNYRIRKINSTTGIITTIAGKDSMGYSGDGGPAVLAKLTTPIGICADKNKNIIFTDYGSRVIRKIDAVTGKISTIAGTGALGYSGDGGPAVSATLNGPVGIQMDKHSNIYFCDGWNNVVRRIDSATGIITTVAGDGYLAGTHSGAYAGDSGLATVARLNNPSDLQINDEGDIFICDYRNHRIRKVDGSTGIITTIAGTGVAGFLGDGGLATLATFKFPFSIRLADSGIIYVTDQYNYRIRKLTPHDTSVSVNTAIKHVPFSIYPNPAANSVQLTVNREQVGSNYLIRDLSGKVLLSGRIILAKQSIDVSMLPAGNYFIQVMNKEGNKQTLKFVKE